MRLRTNETVPHTIPKIIKLMFSLFYHIYISLSYNLLYIKIGKIKAKPVQANAPERLMKRPNLGITYAKRALIITITVLNTMFFINGLSYFSNGFGEFLNKLPFSVMSNAGTICIGYVPSNPRQ